jgi:hypothetical protein
LAHLLRDGCGASKFFVSNGVVLDLAFYLVFN